MRRGPRRIWHRGRGRRGGGGALFWVQVLGFAGVLIVVFGYIIKLFFFSPAGASDSLQVLLPLVIR